jgi:thiol-disulfide isomerase/thioredoxin
VLVSDSCGFCRKIKGQLEALAKEGSLHGLPVFLLDQAQWQPIMNVFPTRGMPTMFKTKDGAVHVHASGAPASKELLLEKLKDAAGAIQSAVVPPVPLAA